VKKLFWFIFGIIFIVFLVNLIGASFIYWRGGKDHYDVGDANIGVIEVRGIITDSMPVMEQIRELDDHPQMKAVVVRIDSPGGAVGASQEIFWELRKLRSKMPVIVSMGNLAASGGLYVSLAGQHVFALPGTLTGSMGVIASITNVARLLRKIYVDPVTIRSGPLKDAGNPLRPMDRKSKEYLQSMVNATFAQFKKDVQTERKLSDAVIKKIGDGRVLNGSKALQIGLVNEIGSFNDAVDYAKKKANIEGKAKLAFLSRKPRSLLAKVIEGGLGNLVHQLNWDSESSGLYYLLSPAAKLATEALH